MSLNTIETRDLWLYCCIPIGFFLTISVWSKNLSVHIVIKSEVSWSKRINFRVNKFITKNKNTAEKKKRKKKKEMQVA